MVFITNGHKSRSENVILGFQHLKQSENTTCIMKTVIINMTESIFVPFSSN